MIRVNYCSQQLESVACKFGMDEQNFFKYLVDFEWLVFSPNYQDTPSFKGNMLYFILSPFDIFFY